MNINIKVPDRFLSYVTDWDYEKYLLVGGYGSGKSRQTATKITLKLLQETRTALVVRNVFATIKESCFELFKEVISDMDMLSDDTTGKSRRKDGKIVMCKSPMEIRFPNGSRIIFKGLDNIQKLKSVHGVSIVWIEECAEIRYDAYLELLGRVRESKVSQHFILTCNPVGRENWVYNMFFTNTNDMGKQEVIQSEEEFYRRRTLVNRKNGMYYHHSILDDNPFLPSSFLRRFDEMKRIDKMQWLASRWGRFGTAGKRVLPRFTVAKDAVQFKNAINNITSRYHFFGIDFGFEESYNALVSCCVDDERKILYIYDEVYINNITDDRFIKRPDVQRTKARAERCNKSIVADCASSGTIAYMRQEGFPIKKCKKYPGSRLENTKKLRRFNKIICSPKCINAIKELSSLTYKKDAKGNLIYDEFNIDPHTFKIWQLGVYKSLEKTGKPEIGNQSGSYVW